MDHQNLDSTDNIEKGTGKLSPAHADGLDTKAWAGDAKEATETEHSLTFLQSLKIYRKSVFWSALVSTTIIMEGYDNSLIGSFFGYPSFQEKFGTYHEGVGYQLSGAWQAGFSDAGAVGNILGAFANGYAVSKFGHRRVLLVSLVAMVGFIFIVFFAPSVEVLLVGQVLCGIPWGVFATMGPSYASEVCPLQLRGYLLVYVNLCWAIGQLISAGVLNGLVDVQGQWGYRIPFAVQWVWPLPLFAILFFAPESPWWLVRSGRLEEAERSLNRLSSWSDGVGSQNGLALIVHTIQIEEEMESGSSYWDCIKGLNLRRTEIACVTFLGQVATATSVRTKTIVLGRNSYYIANIIGGILEPYMMNPVEWNWKGKTAFFWGTGAALMTLWAFFRLPETKGRTYGELDLLFAKKISARKFRDTVVNEHEE
ncbi:hypothetical protein ACLOAV_004599 [Pseudogymnoascus australis]